jgi:putative transposase
MAKPYAPPITIPTGVYPILEKIIKSGKEEKRLVERALFIVRMAAGKPNTQIGSEFKVQSKTVKKWRARWLENEICLQRIVSAEQSDKEKQKDLSGQVRSILSDQERPGTPMKYSAEQYCQVLQVTLEAPSESGRPINDWSNRELAEEVNKRGICEKISTSQVGRFLKKRETSNRI